MNNLTHYLDLLAFYWSMVQEHLGTAESSFLVNQMLAATLLLVTLYLMFRHREEKPAAGGTKMLSAKEIRETQSKRRKEVREKVEDSLQEVLDNLVEKKEITEEEYARWTTFLSKKAGFKGLAPKTITDIKDLKKSILLRMKSGLYKGVINFPKEGVESKKGKLAEILSRQ